MAAAIGSRRRLWHGAALSHQQQQYAVPLGIEEEVLIRVAAALLFVVWVAVYWRENGGIRHFLWFCDTILALFFVAVISNSCFLMSVAAMSMAPFFMWTLVFLLRFIADVHLGNMTDYMADNSQSFILRAWSLAFHLLTPPCIVGWLMYHQCGCCKPEALGAALLLAWVVLLGTRFGTDPKQNINLVFSKRCNWVIIGAIMTVLIIVSYSILIFVF